MCICIHMCICTCMSIRVYVQHMYLGVWVCVHVLPLLSCKTAYHPKVASVLTQNWNVWLCISSPFSPHFPILYDVWRESRKLHPVHAFQQGIISFACLCVPRRRGCFVDPAKSSTGPANSACFHFTEFSISSVIVIIINIIRKENSSSPSPGIESTNLCVQGKCYTTGYTLRALPSPFFLVGLWQLGRIENPLHL